MTVPEGAAEDWQPPKLHLVRDQKKVMEALAQTTFFTDATGKSKIPWATGYKALWTLLPLDDSVVDGEGVVFSDSFRFTKTNGVSVDIEWVGLKANTIHHLLSADSQSLFTGPDRQKIIRALNAFVMRHVSQTPSKVIRVGANKLFNLEGWSELTGGVFRTMRGYFTSLRPALGNRLLLNINAAISAFFKPMLVSEFIWEYARGNRAKTYEAMKCLTGVEVRITYQRPDLSKKQDGKKQDNNAVNGEGRRRKYISEFYWPLNDQSYYNRDTLACYKIADYYYKSFPGLDYENAVVNVGGKVGHANSNEKLSKGLFYPQELLEVVLDQVFSRVLNPDDGKEMIKMAASRPVPTALSTKDSLLAISDGTDRQVKQEQIHFFEGIYANRPQEIR